MLWTDISAIACLIFYAMAAVAAFAVFLGYSPKKRKIAGCTQLCGFAFHTLWLCLALFSGLFSTASRGFFLMPLAWILTAAAFALAKKQKNPITLLFAAPWNFFLCACAWSYLGGQESLPITAPLFLLHIVCIFIGIGVMAIAAGTGCLFLLQERSLKKKSPLSTFRKDLPSLNALDKINAVAANIGFPAYTFGILSGFLWSHISGSSFSADVKSWFSLLILVLYAILFHQRHALGWQGKKPAVLAIVIFAASLFSMLIINTFFSVQHTF